MTLQQLKYVIEIVNSGSITEASKRLYISQPSLSTAVKELENEMGIEIFNRTSKGISLSSDGVEFLSYARQVIEQTELLELRYKDKKVIKKICSISTQHYAFAVNAFSNLIKKLNVSEYEVTLRETKTYEIINDVANFYSEIGILYLNSFNKKVLTKLFKENNLKFIELFKAEPHVFISKNNPLANKSIITIDDLKEYPFLCFEQGNYNSFYFSEEILSTLPKKKIIHVSDRATLFNLLIGLNGYTICTGILNSNLNGNDIVSVPLDTNQDILIGYLINPKVVLSKFAKEYIQELKDIIQNDGYSIIN